MKKRGQFTLFVVLGIVLVLLVFLVYLFREDIFVAFSEELSYPSEVQEVVDWNTECLDAAAKEAVSYVSLRAGHYGTDSSFAVDFGDILIPYGYYSRQNTLLSLDQIELNMEAYLKDIAPISCYFFNPYVAENNLSLEGFDLEVGIEDETVQVTWDVPMSFTSESGAYNLDAEHISLVPVRLGFVHGVANHIVEDFVEDPSSFDTESMLDYGVSVDIVQMLDGNNYLIRLVDSEIIDEEGNSYVFVFMGYFDECYEDEDCGDGFTCEENFCVGEEA